MAQQLVQLKNEDIQKLEQEVQNTMQKVATTDAMHLDTLMDEITKKARRRLSAQARRLRCSKDRCRISCQANGLR